LSGKCCYVGLYLTHFFPLCRQYFSHFFLQTLICNPISPQVGVSDRGETSVISGK
jgi:hypothetical protein